MGGPNGWQNRPRFDRQPAPNAPVPNAPHAPVPNAPAPGAPAPPPPSPPAPPASPRQRPGPVADTGVGFRTPRGGCRTAATPRRLLNRYWSNSPCLTPSTNERHSIAVKNRTGPFRSLESRTAVPPSGRSVISTQAPP